jgi:hypothetical protein
MTQMLRIKNGFFTFLISENLLNLRPKTALTYLLFYEFRGEKGNTDETDLFFKHISHINFYKNAAKKLFSKWCKII